MWMPKPKYIYEIDFLDEQGLFINVKLEFGPTGESLQEIKKSQDIYLNAEIAYMQGYQVNLDEIQYANKWQEELISFCYKYDQEKVNLPIIDTGRYLARKVKFIEEKKHKNENWEIIKNPRIIALGKVLKYTPEEAVKYIIINSDTRFDTPNDDFLVYTLEEAEKKAFDSEYEQANQTMWEQDIAMLKPFVKNTDLFTEMRKQYIIDEVNKYDQKILLEKAVELDIIPPDTNLDEYVKTLNFDTLKQQVIAEMQIFECDGPKKNWGESADKDWYIETVDDEYEIKKFFRDNMLIDEKEYATDYANSILDFGDLRDTLSSNRQEFDLDINGITYYIYPIG